MFNWGNVMFRQCTLIACALTMFVAATFAAENSSLILNFGGSPGEPIPHSYDYGLPEDAGDYYTMRIPVVYADLAAVFHDTEVTVQSADKTVSSIYAVRAYKSLKHCNDGLAVVKEKLALGLPREYAGSDQAWQRQSPDGAVVGRVVCEKARRRPFFTIRLNIALAK